MATSSLPPITSLGSGSNLPLQDILTKLEDNEKQQLTLIQQQQATVKAQISAYGTLQQAVEALQTATQALSDPDTYAVTTAKVSGDGTAFSVKTESGATPSVYTIQVDQLATQEQLKSGVIDDRKQPMGSGGTITVTMADGTSKTIDVSNDTSLNGIAKAINADDDVGVSASIINDGSGKSYLVLTSRDTGTEAAVKSVTSTNSAIQDTIGYDSSAPTSGGLTQSHAATDAQLRINDVVVTSHSNTVDDAIDNVTISLNEKTTSAQTVTITTDESSVVSAVQSFVSAYNALNSVVNGLTAYDPTTNQGSALTGDSTPRAITSDISGALRVLSSGSSTLKSLADLGITTDPTDGSLDLNLDTLDATHLHSLNDALDKAPKDAESILTALGTSLNTAIDGILGTNGMIANRVDGLNQTQDSLQDTYDSTSDRIDADIANIRAQFVQLDAFVAQMNSTSSYLTQQFASLSNQNK
jgi:flagellar hook-associated protein 2